MATRCSGPNRRDRQGVEPLDERGLAKDGRDVGGQALHDVLWHAASGHQAEPGLHVVLRQSQFGQRGSARQWTRSLGPRDHQGFESAALNERHGPGDSGEQHIDLARDGVVECGSGASIGNMAQRDAHGAHEHFHRKVSPGAIAAGGEGHAVRRRLGALHEFVDGVDAARLGCDQGGLNDAYQADRREVGRGVVEQLFSQSDVCHVVDPREAPQEFERLVRKDLDRWPKLIRELGVTA